MFRAVLPRHVRFECRVEPGLGVSVPRHRLAQAIFNLVQNAGEAMAGRESGEVGLRIERWGANGEAGMVRMLVSDDGPGMAPEVLGRCFEPYFSTKGRAIATGMGLGMVKGIIEAAHGTITVDSTPGVGTLFTVLLPAARAAGGGESAKDAVHGAAITLKNIRIAKLAEMFLEHLEVRSVRHGTTGVPRSRMWIADLEDRQRVEEYLAGDPRRRVIVAGGGGWPAEGAPRPSERVLVLAESPAPTALRNAIVWALARGERAEGE
jgi:anti-sigma regulatory factor (Ser/Thr protein kinase)